MFGNFRVIGKGFILKKISARRPIEFGQLCRKGESGSNPTSDFALPRGFGSAAKKAIRKSRVVRGLFRLKKFFREILKKVLTTPIK